MQPSARNVLPGKAVEIVTGAVTSQVRLDIGDTIVTSSITNDAAGEPGLTADDQACAVIKASDVMIGKDRRQ